MSQPVDEASSRRLFLRFLAGSPVLACLGLRSSWPDALWAGERPCGSAGPGTEVWYQLYPTPEWRITEALVKRAEDAGCPVLCLTVDIQGGSNRETLKRARKADSTDCTACHQPGLQGYLKTKPMFDGLDVSGLKRYVPQFLTWDFVHRLKNQTRMKLIIKGIVTREDARLCVENGVDGVIVSNHGGRAGSSGRSTIGCLPEVLDGISGRIPVLIDSGFRRGTDIFKALALGAQGVCIGRPYLWGLAAFGQEGVEAVLDILRVELEMVMKQTGTTSIGRITPSSVMAAAR